ncbi:MAG: hypothetical protein WC890_07415 [Candidatus Margulisiibacteriota bacterium]
MIGIRRAPSPKPHQLRPMATSGSAGSTKKYDTKNNQVIVEKLSQLARMELAARTELTASIVPTSGGYYRASTAQAEVAKIVGGFAEYLSRNPNECPSTTDEVIAFLQEKSQADPKWINEVVREPLDGSHTFGTAWACVNIALSFLDKFLINI